MKNILLLTNFSMASLYAIERFVRVFGPMFSKVYRFILVNAWHQPQIGHFQMINLEETLQENSETDLIKQKRTLLEILPGTDLEIITRPEKGEIVAVLNRLTDEYAPELIVLGTKGSNLLREILVGSTTSRILRKSRAPVLMIPESVRFTDPQKIVFVTDLEICENTADLEKLAGIARAFMAEFVILHFYPDDKPATEEFERCMEPYLEGINASFVYKQHVNPVEGISEFAHNVNTDILALVMKDSGLLVHLFKYRVTSKLTQRADLPMLILHGDDPYL